MKLTPLTTKPPKKSVTRRDKNSAAPSGMVNYQYGGKQQRKSLKTHSKKSPPSSSCD